MDYLLYEEYKKLMIGKRYRHFKGTIYVVDNITIDTENEIFRVIYHAENNKDIVWDRPLSMFESKVDKEKYPEINQELRFQPIE